MDIFTAGWITLLTLGGALEVWALVRKEKGDTLSEHVWKWFSVKHDGKAKTVRRVGLGLIMGWLLTHFITGGMV